MECPVFALCWLAFGNCRFKGKILILNVQKLTVVRARGKQELQLELEVVYSRICWIYLVCALVRDYKTPCRF